MIVDRPSGVVVESNMDGVSYKAGIDDENMTHIIGLFTDLYSDQKQAVIREYTTNARDAMIAAKAIRVQAARDALAAAEQLGQDTTEAKAALEREEAAVIRPVEVTLPTSLSPFFKVRDYGVGLTHDDIATIYSRYGTSTKRGTNDQQGALGLGCKSALTYTQQFTVESVKDGVKMTCAVSRFDDGVPTMTVIDTSATDDANGTTITVPVQRGDHEAFARKAAEFFGWWDPTTVLINGQPPKPHERGLKVADGIHIQERRQGSYNYQTQRYEYTPSLVIMGNVAYPVRDDEFSAALPNGYRLIAEVPIGSVRFAPSREALMYDKSTMETLEGVKERLLAGLAKSVEAEIAQASDAREAIIAMKKWRNLLPAKHTLSLSYKGRAIPEMVEGSFIMTRRDSSKLSEHIKAYKGFNIESAPNVLVVVGYDLTNFTPTHKRKLLQYATEKGLGEYTSYALIAEKPDSPWLVPSQIIKWDDVKAVQLPRSVSTRSGRPSGSYDCWVGGRHDHLHAADINEEERIFYVEERANGRRYADIMEVSYPGCTVVYLPSNRKAKFLRYFSSASPAHTGVQEAYTAWTASLPRSTRLALTIYDESDWSLLKVLEPSKLDDPDLKKAALIARHVNISAVLDTRKKFNYYLSGSWPTAEWADPLPKYRLLEDIYTRRGRPNPHLYVYLNAAYAAHQEESESAGETS